MTAIASLMSWDALPCLACLTRQLRPSLRRIVGAWFSLCCIMLPAHAHDMPNQVQVHMITRIEGQRLVLLLRIPLEIMLNIDFPKQGSGYLALEHAGPALQRALDATERGVKLHADDHALAPAERSGRISLPSVRAFDSYESASALLAGPPLPASTDLFWNQGYFDARLVYPLASAGSAVTLDFLMAPGLRDRLKIDLRHTGPDGTTRAFDIAGGAGAIELDPRWHQAMRTFVVAGFQHILDGPDHLLFLVCLVIPLRRLDWQLVGVISAFTLGHCVTLIAAAYRVVPAGSWFGPLVELLIAASILVMAFENCFRPRLRRRWMLAAAFGLVHGFGFSFLLQSQLQFAGAHLLLSLIGFNLGIELGQLLVLGVTLPILALLFRYAGRRAWLMTISLSLLGGHIAWHWLGERWKALRAADWSDAILDLPDMAAVLALSCCLAALIVLVLRRRMLAQAVRRLTGSP